MRKKLRNHKPIEWRFEGACIRCTSHLHNYGYPYAKRRGITRLCRAIMINRHGAQPNSIVSRHTCDNRWCINPDHIIPGTNRDNALDAMERGGLATGNRLPQTKLTVEQVVEIRALDLPQTEIARRFGIGQSQVGNIRRRKWWRHIP